MNDLNECINTCSNFSTTVNVREQLLLRISAETCGCSGIKNPSVGVLRKRERRHDAVQHRSRARGLSSVNRQQLEVIGAREPAYKTTQT